MPCVDGLDVLARDGAADDLVDELVAAALLVGLELDHRVAVLAAATGLADEAAVALGRAADRRAVGHLRLADVGGDLELAHHAVDEHVEVQLAHAGDEGLAALLVGLDAEGRVLLGQALERDAQLVLVGLGLGLDGHLDDRLREGHRLEDHRVVGIGERVAGEGVLEADGRGDVARVDLVDLLAVVGVHLEEAADALLLALDGVEHVRAGLERAGVDPEEGQLADERVGGDLEGERRERLVVVDRAHDLVAGARVHADDRRDVERRRQVVDDRVEHGLDALVLERRAGEHRHDPGLERAQAQAVLELGLGELLALEVLVRQVVVHLGDGLDHGGAMLLGLARASSAGIVRLDDLLAEVVVVADGLHLDQVDDALEAVLAADRDLDRHDGATAAPRRSRIDSTPRQKSAPVRSSLLMKQKRGTP